MKVCSRCKLEKPLEDFNKSSRNKDGRHGYCRECSQLHYRQNAERHKANVRVWKENNKGYKYGLTKAEHDALRASNDGLCHICHLKPAVHIDHDHTTGEVRGHLCQGCNFALGFFEDDPVRMANAIRYLS